MSCGHSKCQNNPIEHINEPDGSMMQSFPYHVAKCKCQMLRKAQTTKGKQAKSFTNFCKTRIALQYRLRINNEEIFQKQSVAITVLYSMLPYCTVWLVEIFSPSSKPQCTVLYYCMIWAWTISFLLSVDLSLNNDFLLSVGTVWVMICPQLVDLYFNIKFQWFTSWFIVFVVNLAYDNWKIIALCYKVCGGAQSFVLHDPHVTRSLSNVKYCMSSGSVSCSIHWLKGWKFVDSVQLRPPYYSRRHLRDYLPTKLERAASPCAWHPKFLCMSSKKRRGLILFSRR